MIKAIFFDLGGVVFEDWEKPVMSQLAAAAGVQYETLTALRRETKVDQQRGKIRSGDFVERMKTQLNARGDIEDLWHNIVQTNATPNREVFELVRILRHTHIVGVVSNITDLHASEVMKFGLKDLFHPIILSCDVGMIKPEPEIFHLAVHQANVQPAEAIFIDDIAANANGASQAGLHGLVFTTVSKLLSDLRNLGINVTKDDNQ